MQVEGGRFKIKMEKNLPISMDMSLSKPWEMVKDKEAWHTAVHGSMKSWT